MYKEINCCRICYSANLVPILSLGEQFLTGVFPKRIDQELTKGPLDLIWCFDCGLVQLKQTYDLREMYGVNYGYRSGLNPSMANHLINKIKHLEKFANLQKEDMVIDIGSNDGTSLNAYEADCIKVGIDPTAQKFSEFYNDDIQVISDFFTATLIKEIFPTKKAKIITSIAMFYDLEDPNSFVIDIEQCLDDNGIWHFEQSYLPSMLRTNSYDTICHEHLEYYSLSVVKELLAKHKMKIIDVQLNSINGGSFAVTACKNNSQLRSNDSILDWLLKQEEDLKINTIEPYKEFEINMHRNRASLLSLISSINNDGKKILGYGASTKGNVLLQFCNITSSQIPFIAEINEEKYGCYTPGTNIPIISEIEAKEIKPDYFLVLPWHFRENILRHETDYLNSQGKFIFPLPFVEII